MAYYFLEDKKNSVHDSPEYEVDRDYDSYKLSSDIQVSDNIVRAIKRATKINPEQRFSSIDELILSWGNISGNLPS